MKILISLLAILSLVGCKTTEQEIKPFTYNMSEAQLKSIGSRELCLDGYFTIIQPAAAKELASRKVNCTPYVKAAFQPIIQQSPSVTLCHSQMYDSPKPISSPLIAAEIKKRGLDCPGIMQAEFSRQGAEAQDRAAEAALFNSLNANRPRTTNCYGYGYGASCTTY